MQILKEEIQSKTVLKPEKKVLFYNINTGAILNDLPDKMYLKSAYDVNDHLRSLENDFQTAVMDLNTYNILKEFSNPPFPGKRNFVVTTDEDLLNSSVESLEFARIEDVTEYVENDPGKETILIAVSRELRPVFLNGNTAKELAIAFDPLIEGNEAYIDGNSVLNLEYNGYFRYNSGLIRLNYKVVK